MQILEQVASIAGWVSAIITAIAVIVKPIRYRVFRFRSSMETDRCMLRNEIVKLYYANRDQKKLMQYEFENLGYMYKQYKDLKGNSFVDKIYTEMMTWEVV